MPTINSENAKSIRKPFQVRCGLSQLTSETLTFSVTGHAIKGDIQTKTALSKIADLAGGGFPLDGKYSGYDSGVTDGIGVRSHVGQGFTVKITCTTTILAVTIDGRGAGTVSDGINTYDFINGVVVPIGAKTKTLIFSNSDPDGRMEIESIYPGVEFEFTNDNLISCVLALRSDLDPINPSWQQSEIEIQGYYPNDLTSLAAGMGDGQKIYYYAGYAGDWSPKRYFYLSEGISIITGIMTIKGVDASSKLDYDVPSEWFNHYAKNVPKALYNRLCTLVTDSGIKLRSKQAAPPTIGTSKRIDLLKWPDTKAKDIIADIMNLGHVSLYEHGEFWPVFVDAGIPTVRWDYPESKWDIYESDCADFERTVDRNIRTLKTSEPESGLTSAVTLWDAARSTAATVEKCKKGKIYTQTLDGLYTDVTVSPGEIISVKPGEVTFKAGAAGTVTIKGRLVQYSPWEQSITAAGITGVTEEIRPFPSGSVSLWEGYTGITVYPDYYNVLNRSRTTGSFTWKGDPRMQPRDVFTLYRLNGDDELCTIKSIELTHEGGGTTAKIEYRLGVV